MSIDNLNNEEMIMIGDEEYKIDLQGVLAPKVEPPVEKKPKTKPKMTKSEENAIFKHIKDLAEKTKKEGPKVPSATDEKTKHKQDSIYKIQKYQASEFFGDIVRNQLKIKYSFEQLHKKKQSDLDSILTRIRIHVDNINLDKFYNQLVLGGCAMLEQTLVPIYNIDGFTQRLTSKEQFWHCLERVKIESTLPQIPAGVQLAMIIGQTIIVTHKMNEMGKPEPEEEEEEEEEYKKVKKDVKVQAKLGDDI